jgi:hypothetical protein
LTRVAEKQALRRVAARDFARSDVGIFTVDAQAERRRSHSRINPISAFEIPMPIANLAHKPANKTGLIIARFH